MLIPCPLCGPRDRREFHPRGGAEYLDRPDADAPAQAWDALLHLRTNPAGRTQEVWQHECCGAWLEVDRCTVTHRVFGARLVSEARDAG
ncbi:sarcosine oxidase subunit delta [Rhodobaculum claviforme]|uniref:Sarcosine oxidase subunit delta n=1 Tax=Rhodobaculum claviforme TaxID=1549854 RepID=A0A934TLW3_9RHOB|nr:sarcosine oxidase subunit delta [Rhodobaculum claviforme]MBK5928028.1 sarcosine oxidase subunit delta [Rhodobaculum claviforme]